MNVTLIGMASAGKSYLGKKMSDKIGYGWFDSDVALSEHFGGKDIQTILEELGEEKYLQTEAALCIEKTRNAERTVISPAGSIAYVPAWMDHQRSISKVVYLKVPFEMVEARLKKVPPRAIIGLGRKSLRELYDERHPIYEQAADLVLEPMKLSPEELMGAVYQLLGIDSAGAAATI